MEHNKNRLDDLFSKAKNEAPKVSFDEIKANFVNATSSGLSAGTASKFVAFTNLKTLLIMITSVISAVTIISIVVTQNNKPSKQNKNINTITPTVNSSKIIDSVSSPIEAHKKSLNKYIDKVKALKLEFKNDQNIELNLAKKMIDTDPEKPLNKSSSKGLNKQKFVIDTSFHFPTLTADEIKENNKQKTKMIKQLIKLDKKQYAFIPSGSQVIHGNKTSINAFYMQTTEVSNLEYRTFLFDLLINDKKETFLKAKPNQKMWVTEYEYAYNQPMQEHYFSHPAYDNYPVVAITREGAELYCKWLTEEANKLNAQKGKNQINDLRIPSDYEWIYAARGGNESIPYPWGGPYLRNSKGCHLANYMPENGKYKLDGAFHTAEVTSYFPNNYGLYCMSGNAAEMIYYKGENNMPGTKGGSWTSIGQELQIEDGKDRFKGVKQASVNIGFRPVFTYLSKE